MLKKERDFVLKLLPKVIDLYDEFFITQSLLLKNKTMCNKREVERISKKNYPLDSYRHYLSLIISYLLKIKINIYTFEIIDINVFSDGNALIFDVTIYITDNKQKSPEKFSLYDIRMSGCFELKMTLTENNIINSTVHKNDMTEIIINFENIEKIKEFIKEDDYYNFHDIFEKYNIKYDGYKNQHLLEGLRNKINIVSKSCELSNFITFSKNIESYSGILARKINLMLSTYCIRDMFNCIVILCSHKRRDGDFHIFPRDLLAHVLKNYVMGEFLFFLLF